MQKVSEETTMTTPIDISELERLERAELIPGWTKYYVTPTGKVFSIKSGTPKQMQPKPSGRGRYLRVCLNENDRREYLSVHRAVATVFIGPPKEGQIVRHLDGNPENNHVMNLSWGTCKENEADKRRHGRNTAGERHHKAKLTEEDVRHIREEYVRTGHNKSNTRALANLYGVSRHTINNIVKGNLWKETYSGGKEHAIYNGPFWVYVGMYSGAPLKTRRCEHKPTEGPRSKGVWVQYWPIPEAELIASLKIAVEELEQHAKDTETHDGCQASKKALAEIQKRVTL